MSAFADIFGGQKYSLLEQYTQIMQELLQSHPSACGFYTIYEVFRLFKFRLEEFIGVYDIIKFLL